MIQLDKICEKLERLLNGTDTETSGIAPVSEKYFFKVYSEGLYLSTIADKKSGKNFIPVIVGSLGGEYNPIPDLQEADYNIQIQILYPVRFKNDFYALNEFLVNNFVGKVLNYGDTTNPNYALSNISVAQYGELQNIDVKEFDKWITNTYKITNPYVMDTFMSMNFTLYLSTAKNLNQANGFIFGNSWVTSLTLTYNSTNYTDESPIFITQTDLSQSDPNSQQVLGTNVSLSFPSTSSYSKELPLYVKNTDFYKKLIEAYLTRNLQTTLLSITESCNYLTLTQSTYTRKYFISSMGLVKAKGELLGITLTLLEYIEQA